MRSFLMIVPIALQASSLTIAADVSHPIFPMRADPVRGAEAVAKVMSVPDETLDAWNPPYADFDMMGCPHCSVDTDFLRRYFTWSPDDPDRMTCTCCGKVFPNDEYPMEHVEKVVTPAGTMREYPYYLAANGRRFFFDSFRYNLARHWLYKQALELARLYTATGDERYAGKAAVILRRFATTWPELPVHGWVGKKRHCVFYDSSKLPSLDGVYPVPNEVWGDEAASYPHIYPPRSTRHDLHLSMPTPPLPLVHAYDQIANTLSNADRKLIANYFRQTVNYSRMYPRMLRNHDPYYARCEIITGHVINEPEFVHGGVIRIRQLLRYRFFADAMWFEGCPGYSRFAVENIEKADPWIAGYSDPPGFIGAESGERFDDFKSDREFAGLVAAKWALASTRQPDGSYAQISDTWHPILYDYERDPREPLAKSRSSLLWATGHANLARGEGANQIQARLQFMGFNGHSHIDLLGFSLFAKEREMACDIGYSHTRLRTYTKSTVAHNTVLVDECSQRVEGAPIGGELLFYDDRHPVVQFVSVRSPIAYPELDNYQRSLVLVKVSNVDAYVVDLFEVAGGRQHDWLLHGDANYADGTVVTSLELTDRPGTLLPPGKEFEMWDTQYGDQDYVAELRNSLGLIRDLRAARTNSDWQADFAVESEDSVLRMHMVAHPATEIIVGRMPSVRLVKERAVDHDVGQNNLLDFWMPIVIARRTGERGLTSRFLAVHEPFRDNAFLESVHKKAGVLAVQGNGFTDYHYFGGSDATASPGDFRGRYAFVRERDGAVETAWLADGTRLVHRGVELRAPEPARGRVVAADGRQLRVEVTGSMEPGQRMYLKIPEAGLYAIPIVSVNTQQGDRATVTLAADPALELKDDGKRGRLTAFPNNDFTTPVTFHCPRTTAFPVR